jgi:hypothetical protein
MDHTYWRCRAQPTVHEKQGGSSLDYERCEGASPGVVCGGGGHRKQACDGAATSSTFDGDTMSVQGMEWAGDGLNWGGTTPLSSMRGHRRPKFCQVVACERGRWARGSASFFEIWAPGSPIYRSILSQIGVSTGFQLQFGEKCLTNTVKGKLPSLVKTPGWRRWWHGLALAFGPQGGPHEDGLERPLGEKIKKKKKERGVGRLEKTTQHAWRERKMHSIFKTFYKL